MAEAKSSYRLATDELNLEPKMIQSIRHARAIIQDDQSVESRSQAWALLLQRSIAIDTPPEKIPTALELWRLSEDLEAEHLHKLASQHGRFSFLLYMPRLLRDFGVAITTAIILFCIYLKYNGQPINIWSKRFDFMDVEVLQVMQGYGKLQINKTIEKIPIFVGGEYFEKGLGTHADSEITIELRKKGRFFSGFCGYPDGVNSAAIRCSIEGDQRLIWESQLLNQNYRLEPFKLELSDFNEFKLVIRSENPTIDAAHAVWLDLQVSDD